MSPEPEKQDILPQAAINYPNNYLCTPFLSAPKFYVYFLNKNIIFIIHALLVNNTMYKDLKYIKSYDYIS